jgi:hypothetical protein
MVSRWSEIEEQLAERFGLDQSEYQWAFDEFLERQLVSDCSLFLVICGNKDLCQAQILIELSVYFLKCGINLATGCVPKG